MRRAPDNVWDVDHAADGRIQRVKRKKPRPSVNHDASTSWTAIGGPPVIRFFCLHPPFSALVMQS